MQVKSDGNSRMGLLLQLISDAYETVFVLFADNEVSSVDKLTNQCGKVELVPVKKIRIEGKSSASWILHEASIAMSGYTITDISLYCYMGKQDQEEPKLEDSSLYSASLGHISIFAEKTLFPAANSWSMHLEDISMSNDPNGFRTLSLTVIWNQKEKNVKSLTKYNIYIEKIGSEASSNLDGSFAGAKDFLGVAAVERFYARDLVYPAGSVGLKFIVQPCGPDGTCQELDECPALVYAQ